MTRRSTVLVPLLVAALAGCSQGSAPVEPALPPVVVNQSVAGAAPPTTTPPTTAPSALPTSTVPISPAPGVPAPPTHAAPGPCVSAQELAALPLRQQLGQLLMVGVNPANATQTNNVVAQGVGGVFVGGDATGLLTSGALQRLQTSTRFGVLVAADEEGGRVQRIDGLANSIPSARVMAATMTPQQVHDLAYQRGLQLREYGVTVDFAPDADVSDQPSNTVIGDRSFSADPTVVAVYAAAFARGLREAKVLPVLKHFPGHGESSGDSHRGSVSTPPLSALQGRDLVPFRQLIGSAPAVMVGHLDVPGLTEPGVPASLSPAAVGLLRQGSGYGATPFDGVVFTDDLGGMAAVTDLHDVPHAVLDALLAGADVALFITTSQVPAVLDVLEQAVADKQLPRQRVQDSLRRVLSVKNITVC